MTRHHERRLAGHVPQVDEIPGLRLAGRLDREILALGPEAEALAIAPQDAAALRPLSVSP